MRVLRKYTFRIRQDNLHVWASSLRLTEEEKVFVCFVLELISEKTRRNNDSTNLSVTIKALVKEGELRIEFPELDTGSRLALLESIRMRFPKATMTRFPGSPLTFKMVS